jgi:uncharacterized metal-binding protein YceD (DUF177 family)
MSENFSCCLPLDRIRDGERIDLVATDADRTAIAKRLDLVSIDRLGAHCVLDHEAGGIRARGRIKASIEQACIATGEPLPAYIDEPVELHFQAEPSHGPDEEVELSGKELDVIFHDGSQIELGAALADTLALSLDPYPRSPGADAALQQAGVISEEQAGPFAALAALKGKWGEE